MIYLDNAATMYPRPACVKEAVAFALDHAGNHGRSSHGAAFAADRILADARSALCGLFGTSDPSRFVFSHNATDALNTALFGIIPNGAHIVTTMMEHNAVLRPLYRLQKTRNITISFVPPDRDGIVRTPRIEAALRRDTALVVMTHVSNVTGAIMPAEEVGALCKKHGVPFLVDGAQAAGHIPVDIPELGADLYAFPGHKGLCGPQGTGGLYVSPAIRLSPLKYGGTGVLSFSHDMPDDYPEHLEAGTQNVHGISGLLAAVRYLTQYGVANVHAKEHALTDQLIDALLTREDCVIYSPRDAARRSGVVAFNVQNIDSTQVAEHLAQHDICIRAGFHCAPLAHEMMGTRTQGAVRVSFSHLNTPDDVEALIDALWAMK